jgi:uncharacterized coiled-coil DUF342 family protein
VAEGGQIKEKIGQMRDKITELEKECCSLPKWQSELKVRVGQLVEMKIQISEQMFRGLQKVIKVTQELDRITVEDQAVQNELIELREHLDDEKAKYQELE